MVAAQGERISSLEDLAALIRLEKTIKELARTAGKDIVRRLIEDGATEREIAQWLDMTRQNVHKRWLKDHAPAEEVGRD